ncbi:MAG: hypothetical protein MR395_00195 [Caecibacter massiliensis]|uniref:hypothetical protein n=1 Tax=unclassified Megasphaera TaxID=2626256 RepID=UPI0025C28308|nr:hypothetical protein [Megasphaera sp. UBA4233]MCI5531017.1 hypothetical protein [Caecibacter massiliensis]
MASDMWECLADTGCSCDFIEKYRTLTGKQQLQFLQRHRRYLLDSIHDKQIQLDRLDYILYVLQKRGDEGK